MIELRSAGKAYWNLRGVMSALDGIDLTAAAGRVLAVTGAAGSGKSTLLRLLGLQELPDAGEIRLFGRPVDGAQAGDLATIRAQHRIAPVNQPRTTARLALTDALTRLPRLLVWDDADSDLDGDPPAPVLGRLARLAHERNIAVVIAGRDASLLTRHADDVAVLDCGHLVDFGPADGVRAIPSAGRGTGRRADPLTAQPAPGKISWFALHEPALAL